MKYLKYFKTEANWTAYKDGDDYIRPNVSYVVETKDVYYDSKKEFMLRAKYNATPDNLVAFTSASNIKALKVNGNSITIEPIKNENTTFDVLGENISLDMEAGTATFPDSYLIKSPVSSWSFKAKDPNYVMNENTYACMLAMMDGMTMAQPLPLEEAMGFAFTTNDGVTLEAVDEFLADMNMQIQSGGMQVGFTLMDMDMNNGTFVFIDTEHQTNVTTGGLPTYSFDSEGSYDVEIELADPDMKGMQFAGTPLINIEIGDGITSIGEYTFEDCSDLTSVTIGSDVTEIGDSVFYGCIELTDITIGSGVTEIYDYAFPDSRRLTSIVVSPGNTVYDSRENCNCLIETATNRLIKGSNNSFIPDSVTTIIGDAFAYCSGLTGELVIPDSVTSIGNNAFYACTGLTEVTIGSGVTSIGGSAFSGCKGLTSITCYAPTAPSIESNTFSYINKYGTLYYPDGSDYSNWLNILRSYCWNLMITAQYNVTSSNNYLALSSTSEISNLYVNGVEVTNFGSSYSFNKQGSHTIGIILKENTGNIQNMFKNVKALNSVIIDNSGVTTIGSNAFQNCSGLASIVIPDGVTAILYSAFNGCTGLTSINIPDSVTSIGSSAFQNCKSLTGELVIPNSVTTIGDYAFNGCTGLTSINIPDSVTSIGSSAFSYCPGLETIVVSPDNPVYDSRENCNCLIETATNKLIKGCKNSFIPDSVTSIENSAFGYCSGLTSIVIPDSVTYLGSRAFQSCSGLTSIVIPDGVTSIGGSAFQDCSGLTSITIGSGVTSIDSYIFYNCTGLTSIVIPDSVTEIGSFAFRGCSGLKSIVIPDSVTTIGMYAFQDCSGLTSITIGSGVTSIDSYIFYNCTGLTSITCYATTDPSIGYKTFSNIPTGGTLYVPSGSDYSSWMSTGDYYLGKYNWTIQYI